MKGPHTQMIHEVVAALQRYDATGDHIDNVAHGAKEPHKRAECWRCCIEDALPEWGKTRLRFGGTPHVRVKEKDEVEKK